MEQIKLHQWLYGIALIALLGSCSKSSYPERSDPPPDRRVVYDRGPYYRPPVMIVISDRDARHNRRGEMYFDQRGYRYWRYNDGRYYLDEKYGLYREERRNWGRRYRGHR